MVLWEITVATAYFLGLKRTYRLALRIQRRLISPRHPRIRSFLQRRTRAAFDMALSVHKKIQQRDLDVGKSFGNWILRSLDRAKPSAQIRASPPVRPPDMNNMPGRIISPGRQTGTQSPNSKTSDGDSSRRLFSAYWNRRPKSFPTVAMMLQPPKSFGMGNQYRHLSAGAISAQEMSCSRGFDGVFRKDIVQWLLRG